MAKNTCYYGSKKYSLCKLRERLKFIKTKGTECGVSLTQIQQLIHKRSLLTHKNQRFVTYVGNVCFGLCTLVLLLSLLIKMEHFISSRCIITSNYIVMEISRPISDCGFCRNVTNVLELNNVTKAVFAKFAYSGRPVLVKGATSHWSALEVFNFSYFKMLYEQMEGAYDSVEEECQFFPFQTDFLGLKEVFNMSESRASMANLDEEPWYIGWSNCHPHVAEALRRHYSTPHFLPNQSESSAIDWIFMGYSGQGASMHLDYVQRPSWQAQISGTKTWRLLPPPECEHVCHPLNATVSKGDIILVDTNQWYHDTRIHPGAISITIGSEYD